MGFARDLGPQGPPLCASASQPPVDVDQLVQVCVARVAKIENIFHTVNDGESSISCGDPPTATSI
jgi:hypothetical protein